MPSLPVFGKLLLELVVGKEVRWEDVDATIKNYRHKMHAEEILNAVTTCIGCDGDDTFKSGDLIRDSERLRMEFVSRVVLKLQHVLAKGYKMTMEQVFGGNGGIESEAGRLNPFPATWASASIATDTLGIPFSSDNKNKWCLHDDYSTEVLDDSEWVALL